MNHANLDNIHNCCYLCGYLFNVMGEMRMDYYRDDWNDPQDVSEEDHYAEVGRLESEVKDLKHEVAYLLAELMKARDTLVNGAPNEALDDLNWLISTANPEDRINALKILEEAS